MRNIFILGISFGIIFFTTTGCATPSASNWQRESLIGANDKYFYSFIAERANPPSYFEYTETLSLAQYELTTGKLANKTIVRKTRHIDKEANNNWTVEEQQTTSFDLNQFLSNNRVTYAFPAETSETRFLLQEGNLYLQGDKGKSVLVAKSALESKLPWFNQYSKIAAVHELNNNYYVLLEQGNELGGRSLEDDFQQALIVVNGDSYHKSWQLLNQRTSQNSSQKNEKPWQVQVGCFKAIQGAQQLIEKLEQADFKAQTTFSQEANCHRVILIPSHATQDAAKQQAKQLQEQLNIKGYIGKGK